MFKVIREISQRDGKLSSKRFWYNAAGLASTLIIVYLAWTLPTVNGMEDWVFVWVFAVYLITVGGFEVILEMMRLAIQWKNCSPSVKSDKKD